MVSRMTVNPPKISIIIPVYNMEKQVVRCLEHVKRQTLRDLEILCYDDGSSDHSLSLLREIATTDRRIKVLAGPNRGSGLARNACLREATGEYISFLDADDEYYDVNSLEKLYSVAREKQTALCGGAVAMYEHTHFMFAGKQNLKKDGWIHVQEYQYTYGYQCYLYDRLFLIHNHIFFPAYLRHQDPPFFLKAQLKAEKFFCLPLFTYRYNMHPKGFNFYNYARTNDLLRGMTEELTISRQHKLEQLHKLTLFRFIHDYGELFVKSYLSGNKEIYSLLENAENCLDPHIARGVFPSTVHDAFLTPLLEIRRINFLQHGKAFQAERLRKNISRLKQVWAKEAVLLDPYDSGYRANLIHSLRHHGDMKGARREAERYLADFAGDSMGWILHSLLDEQEGNLPKALQSAEKAVLLEPNYPAAYEHYCNMLRMNGHEEKAETLLKELAEAHPNLGWPWRQLSWLECDRGHGDLALQYARQSVKAEPDNPDLREWLIVLLINNLLHDEAENLLEETLKKDPSAQWALSLLIRLYCEKQQPARVLDVFDRAVSLGLPFRSKHIKAMCRAGGRKLLFRHALSRGCWRLAGSLLFTSDGRR